METLGDWALSYADRGWPVFPLKPNEKTPIGGHGYKDATTDIQTVRRWWTAQPDANIGCATGVAFSVLDVDGPDGETNLGAFAAGYKHLGPVAKTGKGFHYLFAPSDRKTVHGNDARFVPKVDFQSIGAYIVMAPSRHPNGRLYEWVPGRGPDLALPVLPAWLTGLLDPKTLPASADRGRFRMAIDGSLIPIQTLYASKRPPILEVAAKLGLLGRGRSARVSMVHCIFHDDSTPSLALYADTNTFWCHGCHRGGDSHQLARRRFGYWRA